MCHTLFYLNKSCLSLHSLRTLLLTAKQSVSHRCETTRSSTIQSAQKCHFGHSLNASFWGEAEGVISLLHFIYCSQEIILNTLKTAASPHTHIPNIPISPGHQGRELVCLSLTGALSAIVGTHVILSNLIPTLIRTRVFL